MRRKRLKKKHYVIDKSQLPYGIKKRLEDVKYLASYKDRTCVASDVGIDVCGHPAIPAHIRAGEVGKSSGMAQRPDDDLTEALCDKHHRLQEASPGPEWWIEYVYKPQRRRAYREWKK